MDKIITLFLLLLVATVGYSFAIYLQGYSEYIDIQILDYEIKINLLFAFSLLVMFAIIMHILFVTLLYIFNIPKLLINYKNKLFTQEPEKYLFKIYNKLIQGKIESNDITKLEESFKYLPEKYKPHLHFLNANISKDFGAKIISLRYLLDQSEYNNFAVKKLAKIYIDIGYWQNAIELVEKINQNDVEILILKFEIYYHLNKFEKFASIINKLNSINVNLWKNYFPTIALYAFKAAKQETVKGFQNNALSYIEMSLLYKPDMFEAIELYCLININLGQSANNLEILSVAFSNSPTFELFELYAKSWQEDADKLYQKLCTLCDNKENIELFLAISAYLKLSHRTNEILELHL